MGFKSFARSTRIELPPGITALVGPNGSGKSNVVDAIRWCLGEQSIRDLRGQRGEDVIHAGTRRVMGFAEVKLTLEADHRDTGVVTSGLSIARRLHRSGESEYLVNGDRARLRDVTGALRQIGVDAGRYVVVTQGMADALLTATPVERRALLEHAAGLSGYRAQREEARQKLSATTQNMVTIETVLAEMEPRMRLLRRQAKGVRDRDESLHKLRARLERWYARKWRDALLKLERIDGEARLLGREREDVSRELEEREQAAESRMESERAFQARLDTARAALHSTQRESDAARFRLQQSLAQEKSSEAFIDDNRSRLMPLNEALRAARGKLAMVVDSASTAEAEAARCEAQLQDFDLRLSAARESFREAEGETRSLDGMRRTAEHEHVQIVQEAAGLRSAIQEQDMLANQARETLDDLDTRISHLDTKLAALHRQLGTAMSAVADVSASTQTAREALATSKARLERAERLRARVRATRARLERRRDSAVRTLAALNQYAGEAALQHLTVPAGWERATASAIGQWSAAHVAANRPRWSDRDLQAFLAWRTNIDAAISEHGTWADHMIGCAGMILPNPLVATLFVHDDGSAERAWERLATTSAHLVGSPFVQVVTRSGVVRSAAGLETEKHDDRAERYLDARGTLTRLDARGTQLDARLDAVARICDHQTDAIAARQSAATESKNTLERVAVTLRDVEREIHGHEAELLRASTDRKNAVENVERASTRRAKLAGRLAEVEEKGVGTRARMERASEASLVSSGLLETCGQELTSLVSHRAELVLSLSGARATTAAHRRMQLDIEKEMERLSDEIVSLETAYSTSETERLRLGGVAEDSRAALASLSLILEGQVRRLQTIESERPSPVDPLSDLTTLRARLSAVVGRHERTLAQYEQLDTGVQALRAEIERELHVSPEVLVDHPNDVPTDEEIRRLRSRAAQYADADESVIREYAEIEERYTGLRAHLEDLEQAVSELEGIMKHADQEMNARFTAAFTAVNAEFGRVFRVMLRGGEAELEHLDGGEGVGIRARLPGKRAQSSAAFSGGERSLVASSLLFGVLNIRPTPFCVLDEVDAALDETNVDRYLAALKDISVRTQIVVVTHNRATMAAADVLYGVTMDPEGVSSLLSLRLDQYEAVG